MSFTCSITSKFSAFCKATSACLYFDYTFFKQLLQLKEFQQKAKHTKKENVGDDAAAKGSQHDEEQNMTASTHSSLSRQSVEEERVEETANVGRQEFGGEQDIEIEQAGQQQVSIDTFQCMLGVLLPIKC